MSTEAERYARYKTKRREQPDSPLQPEAVDTPDQEAVVQTQQASNVTSYDEFKRKERESSAVRVGKAVSALGDPDENAQADQLAAEYKKEVNPGVDVPRSIAKEHKDRLTSDIAQVRTQNTLSNSPMLLKWLENPDNLSVASDDIGTLASIGQWFKDFGSGAYNSVARRWEENKAGRAVVGSQMARNDAERFDKSFSDMFTEYTDDSKLRAAEAEGRRPFLDEMPDDKVSAFVKAAVGSLLNLANRVGGYDKAELEEMSERALITAGEIRKQAAEDHPHNPARQRADAMWGSMEGLDGMQALQKFFGFAIQDPEAFFAGIGQVTLESMTNLPHAAAVTTVTGNPAMGLNMMGLSSYTMERGNTSIEYFTEKGYDIGNPEDVSRLMKDPDTLNEAHRRGHLRGLIVASFERFTGGLGVRQLHDSPLIDIMAQSTIQATGGSGGEAMAQLALDGKIKNYAEVILEGVAEFGGAPVEISTVAGRKVFDMRGKAQAAAEKAAAVKDIAATVIGSKLRERSPKKFEEFVEATVRSEDGVEHVYVDPDQFDEFYQSSGMTPEEMQAVLPEFDVDQVQKARLTGEDIVIPMKSYIARGVGTPLDEFIIKHGRFNPDDLSLTQAEQFEKDQEVLQEEALVEGVKEQVRVSVDEAEKSEVLERTTEQLVEAGRPRSAAQAEAEAFTQALSNLADLSGMSFRQMRERYFDKLDIRGPEAQLRQRTVKQIDRDIAALRDYQKSGKTVDKAIAEYAKALEVRLQELGLDPKKATDQEIRDTVLNGVETLNQDGLPENPSEYLQKLHKTRLGFYSGVEKAVLDMKLPGFNASKKNPDGAALGTEIWNKLKTMQVKKEELEWLGVEEFLTLRTSSKQDAKPRFTREQVVEYIRNNGVQVDENVGDVDRSEAYEEGFSIDEQGRVYDEDEAWEYRIEDEAAYIRDDPDKMEEITVEATNNIMRGLHPDEIKMQEGENALEFVKRAHAEALEGMVDQIIQDEAVDLARDAYFESPYMIHEITIPDGDDVFYLFGNDDIGYSLRHGGLDHTSSVGDIDAYSYGEAYIQTVDYLQAHGYAQATEDENTARWAEYTMNGAHSNYRELKLTLPDLEDDFYQNAHFEDRNIVAFARVNDRKLMTGRTEDTKENQNIPVAFEFLPADDETNSMKQDIVRMVRTDNGEELASYLASRASTDSKDPKTILETYEAELRRSPGRPIYLNGSRKPYTANGDGTISASPVDVKEDTYFVDEMQSDWHQAGRKDGYADNDFPFAETYERIKALDAYIRQLEDGLFATYVPEESNTTKVVMIEWAKSYAKGEALSEAQATILSEQDPSMEEVLKYAEEASKDPRVQDLLEAQDNRMDLNVAVAEAKGDVPNAPFKNDAWLTLALKRTILDAVERGATRFAWADSEVLTRRWSDRYEKLYQTQYDKKMPSIVKKLLKAAPTLIKENHESGGYLGSYWTVEITPEMREQIQQNGFPLFQEDSEKNARGSMQAPKGGIGEGKTFINLFRNADLSTFLHESSHYYLSIIEDMARHPDATPEIRALHSETLEWWKSNSESLAKEAGVTQAVADAYLKKGSTGNPDHDAKMYRATQEQWARATERYLLEGKVPNSKLRKVFEQFRIWLMDVYRKAASILDVEVSDDIRQVFDKLYGLQGEINRTKEDMNDAMLAKSAEELGVTPEEYANLRKVHEEAQDQAAADALAEGMRSIRNQRKGMYKDLREKITKETEAEVNARPVYRAIEWMGNKRWLGDGDPALPKGMRLNKEQLVERYGPGVLRTLPRGTFRVYAPDGMDVDEVAGWFGFENGDGLVKAMETAEKRTEYIEDQVNVKFNMEVETGADAAEQAQKAFHNDRRAAFIAAELRTLNKKIDGAKNTPLNVVRELARRTMSRSKLRDAVALNRYLAAERRAAEEAQRAFAAGDVEAAANAKRKQLYNHSMYVEGKKVLEEVGKLERLAKRLNSKSTRQNLDPDYMGAIDDILEQYDFRKQGPGKEARRERMLAYVEKMIEQGRENEIAIPDEVLNNAKAQPYMTTSVDQMRGVYASLKNIEHMARRSKKLIDKENERVMDEVVGDIDDAFTRNIKFNPPGRVDSKKERAKRAGREFLDLVLNADTLLREIDGYEDGGAVYEHIKGPIDAANTRLQVRRQKAADAFDKLYSVYDRKERNQMAVPKYNDMLGASMSKWDLISIVLNMGNEDNLQRLTDPRSRGAFSEEQLAAVLDAMDKRDMDFVQSVWDYLDSFYPEIAEREKRVTGVAPAKVKAQKLKTKHGTYDGGYYPIKYDPRGDAKVADETADDIMNNMRAGRFGKAQTRNGHTKERKGSGGRMLMVDIGVLHGHVNTILHDLEMSEPVTNAWRILQEPRVKGMFLDSGKQVDHQALEMWVQDTASGQVNSSNVLMRMARFAKSGFTVSKLAFNLSTVAIQITGIAQTMVVIGKKNFALGAIDYMSDRGRAVQEVMEKSPFMAERQTTFNKDIYDVVGDIKVGPTAGAYRRFMQNVMGPMSFWLMQKTQFYGVDMPTWLGAYKAALKETGDEKTAIARADRAVARSQASGVFSDRSPVERGTLSPNVRQNDFVRLFTALGSYMFAKANVAYERTGKTDFRSPREIFEYVTDMALLFTVEAILYNAIKGMLPGSDEDEDESKAAAWAKFIAAETGLAVLNTIPFVRDIASPLQGYDGGGSYGSITDTLAAPIYQSLQGEIDKSLVKSYINAGGMLLHLPSTQINRAVDGLWRWSEGEDVAPVEYIMGRRR